MGLPTAEFLTAVARACAAANHRSTLQGARSCSKAFPKFGQCESEEMTVSSVAARRSLEAPNELGAKWAPDRLGEAWRNEPTGQIKLESVDPRGGATNRGDRRIRLMYTFTCVLSPYAERVCVYMLDFVAGVCHPSGSAADEASWVMSVGIAPARRCVRFQGRARQGRRRVGSGVLADNEASNGLGWKQSKPNRLTRSVDGQRI